MLYCLSADLNCLISTLKIFKGLAMKCWRGIRTHGNQKMAACGLEDHSTERACPKGTEYCEVLDFWIPGIDKPLTRAQCGEPNKKLDKKDDRVCKPECRQDDIKSYGKKMKGTLEKYAKDVSKLSKDCIKELTSIDTASHVGCLGEGCNDQYCNDIKFSQCGKGNDTEISGNTTLASNVTANATTSAGTKQTDDIMGLPKFLITILINASIGAWVMAILLS